MFEYQKNHRFFALVANEMHELAIEELSLLGCAEVKPGFRGLYFNADKAALYRANYCSRLVSKILAPLAVFPCAGKEEFYRNAQRINWQELLGLDTTFAIFANISNSTATHSQYVSLVLKDAIVDQFRARTGKRPSVDPINPDIWFNVYIEKDIATVSFDTSGGPLHKRGYRRIQVEAPMQETLAAAIIGFSGWDGEVPLYDPMCGGGTLLAEAAMRYCRTPAGFLRERFGLEKLPDFDEQVWNQVKSAAHNGCRELPEGMIYGSDIAEESASAARINLSTLPEGKKISVITKNFKELPNIENSVIVCNPPYGIRLDHGMDIPLLYKEFGTFLKRKCYGSTAYIYTGVKELTKAIGLKPSGRKQLVNGQLKGELVKIEVF